MRSTSGSCIAIAAILLSVSPSRWRRCHCQRWCCWRWRWLLQEPPPLSEQSTPPRSRRLRECASCRGEKRSQEETDSQGVSLWVRLRPATATAKANTEQRCKQSDERCQSYPSQKGEVEYLHPQMRCHDWLTSTENSIGCGSVSPCSSSHHGWLSDRPHVQ